MNCDEAARILNAYLDREIDEATARKIEEHLAMCQHCQGHVAFEAALRKILKKYVGEIRVPQSLKKRLEENH